MGSFAYCRKPWKGPEYEGGLNGLGSRLLIIGESHYHKCTSDCTDETHRNLTIDVVDAIVSRGLRHAFFTKIANLFGQGDNLAGFWKSVSFYNFLQESFEGPRRQVTGKMRLDQRNQALFFHILRQLQPNRVLVLGKANWDALPSKMRPDGPVICIASQLSVKISGPLHPDNMIAYWYPTHKNGWALTGAINHPSSFGFRPQALRPWIRRFMSFSTTPVAN